MELQVLYPRLPLKDGDIRLLTILPDEWAADIHCKIGVVSLNDTPEYVALSYVWGGTFQDGTLYINGYEQRIGRSLETALRYYRRAGWSLQLWADAVCINQADVTERSSQVSIMDRIYSSAAAVFVVLGAGIDLAADNYFDKVKELHKFRFRVYGQKYFEAVSPPVWDESNSSRSLDDDKKSSILFSFLERAVDFKINEHLSTVPQWGGTFEGSEESQYPWQTLIQTFEEFTRESWWDRVWTLQESVAARTMRAHITDCCTSYLTNDAPPRYASAVKLLLAHVDNIEKTRQIYAKLRHGIKTDQLVLTSLFPKKDFEGSVAVEIVGNLDSYLLYRYLCMHNRRDATDARDKVYALLSLIKLDNKPSFIYPDYAKGLEDVYITTARMLIQESGSLDILSAAGRLRNDKFFSWVPDWSIRNEFNEDETQINALLMYDAALGTKASVKFPENNNTLLEVEGIILDDVAVLGDTVSDGSTDEEMWRIIFHWMQLAHSHSPNTKWVDFCRTVCTDLSIWPGDQVFRRMGPLTKEMIQSLMPWRDPTSGRFTKEVPPEDLIQSSVEQMKTWFSVWHTLMGWQAQRGMRSAAPSPTLTDSLKITTSLKRFVVSSKGYIGLVPCNSEKGDEMVFFKGCRFPCIARLVPGSGMKMKQLKVVGPCYIDGFMDGQIVAHAIKHESDEKGNWDIMIVC
ncbi:heterokaryon incompatibility protein (HET) domain-containing protein [Trichoderma breve]|uniref:Heterokaryon incompatibility protein (HET) domain-containing protein n=1 Tax=Trichoderma breve TaxID=2034170 RepID=A0A9W9B8V8_9HYPO|nr:heterokaryon incompatibility protein (HET) domain-containing protein [Trichoderma breve]KAJ4858773.1 heterokaryon incompatibility protein (HET) domain-containing protein [Trichoderma breve]